MSQHGAKTIGILLSAMVLLITMVSWSIIASQRAATKAEMATEQALISKTEMLGVKTDIRHISSRVEYLVNRVDMLIDERRTNLP